MNKSLAFFGREELI
jgi:hypothetical protein